MPLAADWQMLGSLADWTMVGVALLAFVVAAAAARYTARTNRAQQETLELQRKQYAESREAARRAQAEKVTFWEADNELREFMVVNASDSPVFAVEVVLAPRQSDPESRTEILLDRPFVLPTGSEALKLQNPRVDDFTMDEVGDRLRIRFADAAGRFWVRSWDGSLSDYSGGPTKTLMR
jgi:type II secretory pathway pseudopilin PulG